MGMQMIQLDRLLEKIEVDNKTLVLVGMVCLVILYVDYSFFIKSQQRSIRSLTTKIQKTETDIQRASRELTQKKGGAAVAVDPLLKKTLLKEEQLPQLLQDIYSLATRNKVSVGQITPVKDQKGKMPAGAETVTSMLITLEITADYHKIGSLLADIENYEHYLQVEELKVARNSVNYLQQDASIQLRTYVKK